MNETTEFNNPGHEEYLHKSKPLCGYVITILNGYVIMILVCYPQLQYFLLYFLMVVGCPPHPRPPYHLLDHLYRDDDDVKIIPYHVEDDDINNED